MSKSWIGRVSLSQKIENIIDLKGNSMKNQILQKSRKTKSISAAVLNGKDTKKTSSEERKFGCPPADI